MTPIASRPDDLDGIRELVEQTLDGHLAARPQTEVLRASRYLVLAGGRRWRSLLAVAAGRIFRPDAERAVLPFACALELLHAASLALDDLPSMDNAQTRRGKPCVHLIYPRWAVDMAPAFLVNLAYHIMADRMEAADADRLRAIGLLGEMGARLARGQELDLALFAEAPSEPEWLECYALKSGSLFAAALAGGGILCGAGPADADALREAGLKMGQAFQLYDDLADLPSPANPGAPDAGPRTAASLLGPAAARARAAQILAQALRHLAGFGAPADPLRRLMNAIQG